MYNLIPRNITLTEFVSACPLRVDSTIQARSFGAGSFVRFLTHNRWGMLVWWVFFWAFLLVAPPFLILWLLSLLLLCLLPYQIVLGWAFHSGHWKLVFQPESYSLGCVCLYSCMSALFSPTKTKFRYSPLPLRPCHHT